MGAERGHVLYVFSQVTLKDQVTEKDALWAHITAGLQSAPWDLRTFRTTAVLTKRCFTCHTVTWCCCLSCGYFLLTAVVIVAISCAYTLLCLVPTLVCLHEITTITTAVTILF